MTLRDLGLPRGLRVAVWLLPLVALAFVTLRAAWDPIDDVDVGWIVAAGRKILADGAVPRTNGLSFAAPHHPWIMHEWLFGVIDALGFRVLGPFWFAAIAIANATLLGGLVVWRSHAVLRRPLLAAAWATTLFVVSFDRVTSARPIGLALGLPCLLVVLLFRDRLSPRRIGLAIAVEVGWVNLHGSFPLGVVLGLAAWMQAWSTAPGLGRDRLHSIRGHSVALLGLAAAMFMQPYGVGLLRLVAAYALGGDETITLVHEHVLEFSPIWRTAYHLVVAPAELGVLGLIGLVALDGLRPRSHRVPAALTLVFVAMAFVQARNVSLACIVGSLLLQPHVAARIDAVRGTSSAMNLAWLAPWTMAGAAAIGIATLAWVARTRAPDDAYAASLGGSAFLRLARLLPDGAAVFVPFRSAGLLLAEDGDRGVRTFYDSRNDPYPPALARIGLELKDGVLPAEGLSPSLLRYGTTYAIIPRASYVRETSFDARWPTLAVLEPALAPTWRELAVDEGWLLLEAPPR